MTHDELIAKGAKLLETLVNGTDSDRIAALPALEKHISDLRIAGLDVPVGLKEQYQLIHDLALEDQFDNMPL